MLWPVLYKPEYSAVLGNKLCKVSTDGSISSIMNSWTGGWNCYNNAIIRLTEGNYFITGHCHKMMLGPEYLLIHIDSWMSANFECRINLYICECTYVDSHRFANLWWTCWTVLLDEELYNGADWHTEHWKYKVKSGNFFLKISVFVYIHQCNESREIKVGRFTNFKPLLFQSRPYKEFLCWI